MPETSLANRLAAVVEDLITILQNPHPPTPFLQKGNPTNGTIKQLRIIFNVPNNTDNVTNKNDNRTNNQLVTNRSVPRVNQSVPRVNQSVPRVKNTTPTNQRRRPRVRVSLAPINKESRIYPLGTTMQKKFN